MAKYHAPDSDIQLLDNSLESSVPTPGENEGDIIPWDWNN